MYHLASQLLLCWIWN